MAVHEHAASSPGEAGSDLIQAILELRGWAVWFLHELGDTPAQAIQVAGPLLADRERILGPNHPDTVTTRNNLAAPTRRRARPLRRSRCTSGPWPTASGSWAQITSGTLTTRNNLAAAYQDVGRTAEAISLFARTLADRGRILGPDHPDTLTSRNNLAAARASQG